MKIKLTKFFILPLIFIFVSAEVYAAASSAAICRRQGGTWNQWSQKCTKSYKRSYKKKKYNSYKYKRKKSYSNYGSKSRYNNSYKSKSRYKYKKKKTYSNYGSSYGNSRKSKYNSRSTASIKKKALVYCWQNKKRTKWTCDGPTQKLLTFWKTKSKARDLAGCRSYSSERNFGSGVLFKCTKSLKSYDRDIRGKYGISRNY